MGHGFHVLPDGTFAEPLRDSRTPVGLLHRTIWKHIPTLFRTVDARLTGSRVSSALSSIFHRLAYERHPIVLLFFLGLLTGAIAAFLSSAWLRLPWVHYQILIPLFVTPVYVTFFLACWVDPGRVTSKNHAREVHRYPYDRLIFKPGVECYTCHLDKPARSKHCNWCKACISRYDHHCVWINSCVGRGNYVWFLSFLLAISSLLIYGAVLAYLLLHEHLLKVEPANPAEYGLDPKSFRLWNGYPNGTHWTSELGWWDLASVWGFCIVEDPLLGIPGVLCIFCFPLSSGFLTYHIYLLWAGMTTNESVKFADLSDDIKDGYVWTKAGARVDKSGRKDGLRGKDIVFAEECPDGEMVDPTGHLFIAKAEEWRTVGGMNELCNVYDRGFIANIRDAIVG